MGRLIYKLSKRRLSINKNNKKLRFIIKVYQWSWKTSWGYWLCIFFKKVLVNDVTWFLLEKLYTGGPLIRIDP